MAVCVCRRYSGTGPKPETTEIIVMMNDTVKGLAIVVPVISAELLSVVEQKTAECVPTGVSAGVAAVVAQQQTIFVSL